MKKIPTLFLRDSKNMKLVTREVNPEAAWLFEEPAKTNAIPTVKKDGTNIQVTIKNDKCIKIEKRKNPNREEKVVGIQPTYIETCPNSPADKYIIEAVDNYSFEDYPDGIFQAEALGPKIQGGVETDTPKLYVFSALPTIIRASFELSYDGIQEFLFDHVIEGIVWHWHTEEEGLKLAKIKRRDFGLPWPLKKTKEIEKEEESQEGSSKCLDMKAF